MHKKVETIALTLEKALNRNYESDQMFDATGKKNFKLAIINTFKELKKIMV